MKILVFFISAAVAIILRAVGEWQRGTRRLCALREREVHGIDSHVWRDGRGDGENGDRAQFLAFLIARLESGEGVREILEAAAGRSFALPQMCMPYISEALSAFEGRAELLKKWGKPTEEMLGAQRMSRWILVCVRLSDTLGCSLAQTLRVLLQVYRHEQQIKSLRARAFSTPRATVKLLAALPLVTLVGGEFLGAHSFSFLAGSVGGMVCLSLGVLSFTVGLVWVNKLMRSFTERGFGVSNAQSRGAVA